MVICEIILFIVNKVFWEIRFIWKHFKVDLQQRPDIALIICSKGIQLGILMKNYEFNFVKQFY